MRSDDENPSVRDELLQLRLDRGKPSRRGRRQLRAVSRRKRKRCGRERRAGTNSEKQLFHRGGDGNRGFPIQRFTWDNLELWFLKFETCGTRFEPCLSQYDSYLVCLSVIGERDLARAAGDDLAVELDTRDAFARAARVFDRELVPRRVIAKGHGVTRPGVRDARIQVQRGATQAETEDGLDAGTVHPSRRAGVPGPAAAPDVRSLGVDVRGGDVRLDFVSMEPGPGRGVVDGIQDREKLSRLVALPERGEGDDSPERAVRVLPSVLPDSGQVAFDVSGVERRLVKRRREEE